MRKFFGNVLKVIGYMLLTSVLALFYSLKYLLCGKSILGRIAILGMYSGLVVSFLYLPILFGIIFAVLLLFDLILSVSMIRNKGERENERNTYEQYKNKKVYINPFFDGMTFEEAKKEYRKLMKKYHPDNVDGSLEMTQKIAEAYSNYCTACGR